MFEKRKHVRYPTIARVLVKDLAESEALLKDLSVTGCCVEYTINVDVKPHANYKIEVFPESAAQIGKFDLDCECRWVQNGGYSCEVGFSVLASPKGKPFQRYVDYLSYRSDHS
jgi:hypothetical protein